MTNREDFLWNTERFGNLQNVLVVPYRSPDSSPDDLDATRRQLFRMFWGFDESDIAPWRSPTSSANSVAHWYETVSRGRLRLTDRTQTYVTGGDYIIPNTNAGLGLAADSDLTLQRMRGKLIEELADEIDFSAYERGGDVDNNDLIIVMVKRGESGGGGAVRSTDRRRLRLDGVDVEIRVASVAMGTSLSTSVHEIIHALLDRQPSTDMYGPGSWNTPGSLMGSTGPSRVSHPDAQHKILLGWDTPKLIDVARVPKGTSTSIDLLAAGATDTRDHDERTTTIIHDSGRGANEFFVLEYRTPSGGSDDGYRYDRSVGEGGLAIWHVESTGTAIATRPAYFKTATASAVELAGGDRLTGDGWLSYQGGGVIGDGAIALVNVAGSLEVYRYSDWEAGGSWTNTRATILRPDSPHSTRTMAAGDGVMYEVRDDGALLWYRIDGLDTGSPAYADGSGAEVGLGRGWNTYGQILPAGNGVIYAVKPDGSLIWYQHTGWQDGQPTWLDTAEREVGLGRGWNTYDKILPAGNGVIYAVKPDGSLIWYQHTGWQDGQPTWLDTAEREVGLGRGWTTYLHVLVGSDGVFYVVDDRGSLGWYRHLDVATGGTAWASKAVRFPLGERAESQKEADWPGVVHFGPSGTLETDSQGATIHSPASIHLVGAPDGVHGYRHGLWTAEDGDIWLNWYDETSASCRINVRSNSTRSERLRVDIQTGVVQTR